MQEMVLFIEFLGEVKYGTFQNKITSPNGSGYAYDLIPNPNNAYKWLGPFTCNDQTLTCSTPVPNYQAVPSNS
jgi:hypothetical protein